MMRLRPALLGLGLSTLLLGSVHAQNLPLPAPPSATPGPSGTTPAPSAPRVTLPVALPPPYSKFVIFGDSLSDTGNFANTTDDDFGIKYPSNDFNYAEGRFTNDGGTSPAANLYKGVWHEQLATLFFGLKAADPSLDGGTDYAYGDAETLDGQRDVQVTSGVDIHIDNLNRQVSNYLNNHTPDPAALYIVWAGANDLFDDPSAANVTAAAQREAAVVQRLAEAGAKTFLLPNLPPLGLTPEHQGDAGLTQAASDFRTQYGADLDALQTTLAAEGLSVKFYRLDVFDLFGRLIASAGADYGFANITDSAQGEGVKADQYLFWDGVHPTAYGHFQIACEAYSLLTGVPVVEISQADKHVDRNAGEAGQFLFTRTGPDLSATFKVGYTLGGSAVEGADYTFLSGQKKLKAGKRTVSVFIYPTTGAAGANVKLTLQPGDDYALPVVVTGKINLDPSN